MNQSLSLISLVVKDYDEALQFYCGILGFHLVEDLYQAEQDKRWVVVQPPGTGGSNLLLAQASNEQQRTRIGNQTGGRVFLFLYTDDFWHDYHHYQQQGVSFVRDPKEEGYGTVAVFEDLYGTRWDLIQPSKHHFAQLRALEEYLFDQTVRQDAERLDALLHENFTEVGVNGTRYDKQSITRLWRELPEHKMSPHAQNYQIEELSDGLVQLIYESARIDASGNLVNHTRRTSLWQRVGAQWQLRYHQGTPTVAFEKST